MYGRTPPPALCGAETPLLGSGRGGPCSCCLSISSSLGAGALHHLPLPVLGTLGGGPILVPAPPCSAPALSQLQHGAGGLALARIPSSPPLLVPICPLGAGLGRSINLSPAWSPAALLPVAVLHGGGGCWSHSGALLALLGGDQTLSSPSRPPIPCDFFFFYLGCCCVFLFIFFNKCTCAHPAAPLCLALR